MATSGTRSAARTRPRSEVAERLMHAAERLLADGVSYTELSVDELIAEADVSRSTFYNTFEGKGDLLVAWLAQIVDEVEDSADAWWNLGPDDGPGQLHAALAVTIAAYAPHGVLMAAAYEVAPFDPAVRAVVQDMLDRGTRGLRRHIRRGQTGGWVDPALDPDDTAVWLTAMQERGYQQLGRLTDRTAIDRLLAAQTDLIWHVLYAPARKK